MVSPTLIQDERMSTKLKTRDLRNPSLKSPAGSLLQGHSLSLSVKAAPRETVADRLRITSSRVKARSPSDLANPLLESSTVITKGRKGGYNTATSSLKTCHKLSSTDKPSLTNKLLTNHATNTLGLSASARQVTRLASTLTSTLAINLKPSYTADLTTDLTSNMSAHLSQTVEVPSSLQKNLHIQKKTNFIERPKVEKKSRKRATTELLEDTLPKMPRYSLDCSSVRVPGDDKEVMMEFTSPPSAEPVPAQKTDHLDKTKRQFINAMSAALLMSPNFKCVSDKTRTSFVSLCDSIADIDPEFILKVAIYSRKDLNIRAVSNFLLADAAHRPVCRPFLKKYFKSTVMLPSDWIEVAEIYQTFQDHNLNFGSLPTALRKVMVEKFADFDKYQLGKYNKDKKQTKRKPLSSKEKNRIDRHRQSGIQPSQLVSDESSDDESEIHLKTFTLKQLIRQLHISSPADNVLCLIGKKYPQTREEFYRMKLPGEFDEMQAGKRMRLPIPETWETQVSLRGNKAEVWESLIDHRKLPFMAMLRNIRNMLKAGISEKHHQWVIGKLTDEGAIANSKQFPFRFFSAYAVLTELDSDYDKYQEKLISLATKLEDAANKEESQLGYKRRKKKTKEQRRSDQKKNGMRKQLKQDLKYDKELVARYRKALDKSVELATNYNVPPIPGVTLVLINTGRSMFHPCTTYRGMGTPRKIVEVGILLGLMCQHACESSELVMYDKRYTRIPLEKEGILASTARLVERITLSDNPTANIPRELLQDILMNRQHIDNVIVLSDGLTYDNPDGAAMEEFLRAYRDLINPNVLFVSINLSSRVTGVESQMVSKHPNDVFLAGFSDQLLRFVAERGDSAQMTYVENIDMKYGLVSTLPPTDGAKSRSATHHGVVTDCLSPARTLKWRVARVFISSTFLDMHGERDVLTRFVFPEIRLWARKRLVHVLDVDLRWGISEHAANESGSLSLCINEVLAADYFIAILGERTGWIPGKDELPAGEEFDWMRRLPQPQSATALEIQLAMRTKAPQNCFYFIRSDEFIWTVPRKYQDLFKDTDDHVPVLNNLKDMILKRGKAGSRNVSEVFDGYPASWAGVIDNKPMAGDLEMFALRAVKMIKERITADYPLEEVYGDELENIKEWQDGLIEESSAKFKGRQSAVRDFYREFGSFDKGICLIHGEMGIGKTAFWSRLSHEMTEASTKVFRHTVCTGYDNMIVILRRLYQELCSLYQMPHDTLYDYYELVEAISSLLSAISDITEETLIIMIDGLDHLSQENNSQSLNWLPETLPKKVVFLLTCTSSSTPHRCLYCKRGVIQTELRALDVLDKSELVKESLAKHRKALDESPFNNQMKLLTGKRSANNPLYLMLACEQLRFHGVFEEVTEKIKKLPHTLSKLLDYIISNLEVDFGDSTVSKLLVTLYCLPAGVTINDMKLLLYVYLRVKGGSSLEQVGTLYENFSAEDLIATLTFTQLLHRISFFLANYESNSVLRLTSQPMRETIRKRYIKTGEVEQLCHTVISGYYLYAMHELQAQPSSIQYYKDVIFHLKRGYQFTKTVELLKSLDFLHRKCCFGLVTSLNTDYSAGLSAKAGSVANRKWAAAVAELGEFAQFIYRNTSHLLSEPKCLIQLALNEPEQSAICQSARKILLNGDIDYIDWVTKPDAAVQCVATIKPGTVIRCSAISPDGNLLALGGDDCRVHIYSMASCEEKMTLVGHANLISDLRFFGEKLLMSASHDKTASLWDITTGHRRALLDKHIRRVSSCVSTKISLLTAGWDGFVKMWTRDGKLKNDVCRVSCPINDMSIHPNEVYAAIACWDSTVKVYNILSNKRLSVLHGHKASVRSISYSTDGQYISSAALDGEVKLWSAVNGSRMGSYEGHSRPVRDLCFSSDGDRLITAAEDSRIKVWSGQLGLCVDKWPVTPVQTDDSVLCVAINSSCTELAAGTTLGSVITFKVDDLSTPINEVRHKKGISILSLCWCRDSSDVICATTVGSIHKYSPMFSQTDEMPMLIQNVTHAAIHSICTSTRWAIAFTDGSATVSLCSYDGTKTAYDSQQHAGAVLSCSFNNDGKLLATGGADSSIVVWSIESVGGVSLTPQTNISQAHADWITCLSWSDSVQQLASGSNDCVVKLWDFTKSAPPTDAKHELKGHGAAITSVSYKAGCIVSAAMNGEFKVWSHKGSEVTSVKCKSGALNACSLGIRMASKGGDEATPDWVSQMDWDDVESSKPKAATSKAKSDILKEVLVAIGSTDGEVQLWQPLKANEQEEFISTSSALSVCNNSNRLVSTHLDESVRMWTLPSAKQVKASTERSVDLKPNYNQITQIAETEMFLLAGSFDGSLAVWRRTEGRPIWLRQINCSSTAISAINVPLEDKLPMKIFVGAEDGTLAIVNLNWDGARVWLDLLSSTQECPQNADSVRSRPIVSIQIDRTSEEIGLIFGDHRGLSLGSANDKTLSMKGSCSYALRMNISEIKTLKAYELSKTLDDGELITSCASSSFVCTGTSKGRVLLSSKEHVQQRMQAHNMRVTCLIIVDRILISAGADSFVKLWRVDHNGFQLLSKHIALAPVTSLSCSGVNNLQANRPVYEVYCGDVLGGVHRLDFHL
ncbi:telomerase protein component 1-like [Watersipora subatra]|uniref:telomerase protein component 1-like n=1 Tax=Watersipora subatra TaxID=2589382 RepID=UPI00355BCCA5